MAVWSAVLTRDGRFHTSLKRVFDALEGRQRHWDFLLLGVEACPREHREFELVNQVPRWISGAELTAMAETEDFQWVWGALLAYPPDCCRSSCLKQVRALCPPGAPDEESWGVRRNFEGTGAAFLILAADSSLTELVSADRDLIDCFSAHEPGAKLTLQAPEGGISDGTEPGADYPPVV